MSGGEVLEAEYRVPVAGAASARVVLHYLYFIMHLNQIHFIKIIWIKQNVPKMSFIITIFFQFHILTYIAPYITG